MSRRSDQPTIRSRAAIAAGIAGLAVVALAARMPVSQPPAAPPAKVDSQAAKSASMVMDTTVKQDSAAMKMDSAGMAAMAMPMPMPAPKPAAPKSASGWPIDPVTGQTLVNGTPVVGRVFIQQHTDGTVKIENVAAGLKGESAVPLPPIVKHAYTPAPAQFTRRQRTPMVQATEWDMDAKLSAKRDRVFKPTTTGASLGQR